MRHYLFGLALAGLMLLSEGGAAETDSPDGTLLSSAPCPPNPIQSYDAYLTAVRADLDAEAAEARAEGINMPPVVEQRLRSSLPPREVVEEHIAFRGFECRTIIYASGGLRIAGVLWKPLNTSGKRLPLLIALRGGISTYGGMEPWRYWGWHDFLKAGYVVLATQYRGGPGSEGQDGFGSEGDLQDVRNLLPLARALGYADMDRVYMHGGSRGGMQAYMLARAGFPMRAMAIRAGLANLVESHRARPLLAPDRERLMTDFPQGRDAAYQRRSASLWAHEIRVPTILFHGSADWRTRPADSLEVANGLLKARTPFELHLYDGDTHAMTLNEADMIRRTLAFFARHP